jgi:FkbM family methyltransferase
MKILNQLFERTALFCVKILPFGVLSKLTQLLPRITMVRLVSSFKLVKIYQVSLFGEEFSIESGPRDDHYLDLEKDGLRTWEHEALSVWANEVRSAEIAVDVGAYLGIYSILAAKLGCKRVLAFEPNSNNFIQLQQNLSLNHLENFVVSHRVAVGAESKTVSMITPGGRPNSSGSQISNSPTGRKLKSWEVESKVKMSTLDSLLLNEKARISVIKIDAEGYEMYILQGAIVTLKNYQPSILIELLDTDKKMEADIFLENFGYPPGLPIETSVTCTNFFYRINNDQQSM